MPVPERNPYEQETPEWQLFELAQSAQSQADSFSADAERLQERASKLYVKAATFRAALRKLDPTARHGTDQ